MQLKKKLNRTQSSRPQKAKGGTQQQKASSVQDVKVEEDTRAPEPPERSWSESIFRSLSDGVLGIAADDSKREGAEAETVVADNLDESPKKKKTNTTAKTTKKKRFPLISNMRDKMKKNNKNKKQPMEVPTIPEEIITEREGPPPAAAAKVSSKSKASSPLMTYKQWEDFMDTVAFPEKSKTYLAFKEYLASQKRQQEKQDKKKKKKSKAEANERALKEKKSKEAKERALKEQKSKEAKERALKEEKRKEAEERALMLERQTSDVTEDTALVVTSNSEPKITWEQYLSKLALPTVSWSEFMDTCAFPERAIGNTYHKLVTAIAHEQVAQRRLESGTRDDKYSSLQEQRELPGAEDQAALYTMTKKNFEENLGIDFTTVESKDGLYISALVAGSKGAASGLKVGMKVLSINRVPAPETAQAAKDYIASIEGPVRIFAQPGISLSQLSLNEFDFGMDIIEFGVLTLTDALFGERTAKGAAEEADDEDSAQTDSESIDDDATWEKYSFSRGFSDDPIEMSRRDKVGSGRNSKRNKAKSKTKGDLALIDRRSTQAAFEFFKNLEKNPRSKMTWKERMEESDSDSDDESIGAEDDYAVMSTRAALAAFEFLKTTLAGLEQEGRAIMKKPTTLATFEIFKERQTEVVGVKFVESDDEPGVFVDNVYKTSKFASTGLEKGMKLIRINGKECPDAMVEAVLMIRKTVGKLELTVEVEEDILEKLETNKTTTVTISKEKNEYLGLNLRQDKRRGGLFITRVDPHG
eukprot:scaffold22768_cov114-Cylindrotheca_fusiformis.AAC.1